MIQKEKENRLITRRYSFFPNRNEVGAKSFAALAAFS